MMRRHLLYLFIAVLLFTGCSRAKNNTWQPGRVSAEIEPYAKQAIRIIDQYLSFEASSEEASEAFEELHERIAPFFTRDTNSEYSEPDKTIAYIVSMLAIGQAKDRTDVEYHEYRDVLAFQIGQPVSGQSYAADQSILGMDEDGKIEERLKELVDIDSVPFDSGTVHVNDGLWYGSFRFDEKNGVRICDLQQYIETLFDNVVEKNIKKVFFSFYYSRFEQDVLCIHLDLRDGVFAGSVTRSDELAMEAYDQFLIKYSEEERAEMVEYPKEFAILRPLYEFGTIDDLPEVLQVASTFAGAE